MELGGEGKLGRALKRRRMDKRKQKYGRVERKEKRREEEKRGGKGR